MTAIFIRLLYATSKEAALRDAVKINGSNRYRIASELFAAIPTSPFAYWVGGNVRRAFQDFKPFESDGRIARQGLATSDDFRFMRCWFEVPADGHTEWLPTAKGGRFSRFYRDLQAVSKWKFDGSEMKAFAETKSYVGHWSKNIRNTSMFGEPGITWPLRGITFSAQAVPSGAIFTVAGKMAFAPAGDLLVALSVLNSTIFDALMRMFAGKAGGVQYESGLIQRTPFVEPPESESIRLASLARRGWSARRSLDVSAETSHAFVLPALLLASGDTLNARAEAWMDRVAGVAAELGRVQSEIDELCFELYGISEEDRLAIVEGLGSARGAGKDDDVDGEDTDVDAEENTEVDQSGLAAGLVSWAVGVAAGRFDVRLASGARRWPHEPDPFDALPVCSVGMLTGGNGLPLLGLPMSYPVETSPVLVDDPGHALDMSARVRAVFDVAFGENADAWWQAAGLALGAKGGEVGSWLSRSFFDHHLKTYSRSRRKAPILWPIGTRSGSYVVWLYAHMVSSDSMFQVLNDLVAPKLLAEERELVRLRQDAGPNPAASQRKAIDARERLVSELRELRELLEAAAPLWGPDLNDGIVLVLAPFWRLFSHHRAWSSELKKQWVKLANGDYDWAQIAMRLWPERVIPRCGLDRSLAIAHGVEEVFWARQADQEDKWHRRQISEARVNELIEQRRSPAVGAALARMGNL